jgi:hypothetical protein
MYQPGPALVPGTWYEYGIAVQNDDYTVDLTDLTTNQKVRTSTFTNTDPDRGLGFFNGTPAGYIGLQSYANAPVVFRAIQIRT